MSEINLAAVIAAKRREKGITQDELAAYAGVSKASVSKWETGQSFPDITLLPVLAAYFDISIDRLIGYTPQMEKGEIKKLYQRLATEFAEMPFEDIISECEGIIKKYNSCYPLLLQMALLYINHAPLASDKERSNQILTEAVQLCERVEANTKDKDMIRDAVSYQSICYLSLGNGEAVLSLLGEGESLGRALPDGVFIAQAFQLLGKTEKAQEILQIDLYQNLMAVFHSLVVVLQNNLDRLETAEPVYLRAEGLAQLFKMNRLNPNYMAMLYALGAQMYQLGGQPEKAIELLSKYVDVCIHGFFPVALCGDDFFNKVDRWLNENAGAVPRSEAVIKESMMKDILQSHIFEPLWEHPEYVKVAQKLRLFIGGN